MEWWFYLLLGLSGKAGVVRSFNQRLAQGRHSCVGYSVSSSCLGNLPQLWGRTLKRSVSGRKKTREFLLHDFDCFMHIIRQKFRKEETFSGSYCPLEAFPCAQQVFFDLSLTPPILCKPRKRGGVVDRLLRSVGDTIFYGLSELLVRRRYMFNRT